MLPLTHLDAVPDGVIINCTFALTPPRPFRMFRAAGSSAEIGLRRLRKPWGLQGLLQGDTAPANFVITGTARGVIRCRVTLNPLANLWNARRFSTRERPLRERTNFLPDNVASRDNTGVVYTVDGLIQRIQQQIASLVTAIAENMDQPSLALPQETTLCGLEVAFDMASECPRAVVDSLKRPFRRLFQHQIESAYASTVQTVETHEDVTMVSGYRREGERYKAYPKTNRRVRIEAQFHEDGLRAVLRHSERRSASRRLFEGGESFADLFHPIALVAASQVNDALQLLPRSVRHSSALAVLRETPAEMFAQFASATRDIHLALELLEIIARNDAILNNQAADVLDRLRARGVLQFQGRGRSATTHRYRNAALWLARHLDFFSAL